MLKKICYSNEPKIKTESPEKVLASQELVDRLNKLATDVRAIAPKSDDFLYFSIIFLKAAESAYLDENGNVKKMANGEDAWGFFDENWKWHGNVKPHRNNNCFPAGTFIQMYNGSVKKIEDVQAGDLVITHTGEVKPVIKTISNDYSGNLLEIKSKNNSSVFCTPEHPFFAIKTNSNGLKYLNNDDSSSPSFIEANKLEVGDSLTSNISTQEVDYSSFKDKYRLHYISDIINHPFEGKVYNFQVADNNSYVANGFIVHNCDIFPESQLKIAAKKWVGMPLCRDHESSSVDGIRGIILDAHYDEKFKQVIGLCALDKVNYPDLARKVTTGLVRYGSMGTAVEVSICSECGNRATTQKEYCSHVMNKSAHGEINVGLKPIEYSLVVQPAEPGAILLRCLASLEEYRTEFINYGVENVDQMLGKLNEKQASHLESIMKTACGENGCSIPQRKKIITSFLSNNGFIKESDSKDTISHKNSDIKTYAYQESGTDAEKLTSGETGVETQLFGVASPYSMLGTKNPEDEPDFTATTDVVKAVNRDSSSAPLTSVAGVKDSDKLSINQLLEDIMSETNLKKRAELRRRIAYMQGGESVDDKSYREPSTFKSDKMSETVRNTQDRHLLQDADMDKLTKEDMALKEKLSRADLKEARLRRIAYMQGGESVSDKSYREPSTFKSDKMSETVRNTQDRHLLQDADMNKLTKEDMALKEKLSRASARGASLKKVAYSGPSLTTRFSIKRGSNGSINKSASVFEVFSGDKRVIAATAGEIFGSDLDNNWDWIKSEGYGKEVCRQIRASGIPYVSGLLKSAQELPPTPAMEPAAPADMGAPPAPTNAGAALPPAPDMGAPPAPMSPEMEPSVEEGAEEEESTEKSEDPSSQIDEELTSIETAVSTVRDLVNELKDKQEADVDVNVFTGKKKEGEEDEGKLALSRQLFTGLKKAYRELDSSADELAMVAETYENISKLSSSQRREFLKLAEESRKDSARILGEATSLIRIAKTFVSTGGLKKSAQSMKDDMMHNMSWDEETSDMDDYSEYDDSADLVSYDDDSTDLVSYDDDANDLMMDESDDTSDLVAAAMDMRKTRREAIVKQAESSILSKRAAARKSLLKKAEDDDVEDKDDDVEDKDDDIEDDVKSDDLNDMSALHTMKGMEMGMRSQENMPSGMKAGPQMSDDIKAFDVRASALNARMQEKKAEEERESYRIKLRRAYDVGMDMQRKGLLPHTKVALDKQVDDIMAFDDGAFEAFKRSIANAKPIRSVKVAADLGGVNVGVESESVSQTGSITADKLLSLWD